MKFQLFKTGNVYTSRVFDERRMIPDPNFSLSQQWLGPELGPELAPQQQGECEADFLARKNAHDEARAAEAAAIAARESQIELEAVRLYRERFEVGAAELVADREVQ